MTMAQRDALDKRPPLALMRAFNNVPKALLRSPLHGLMSKRLLLITVHGRKTGTLYTTPVGYVEDGDTLLVSSDSAWSRNLTGGARVRLWFRGERRWAWAELIRDPEGLAGCYTRILEAGPGLARYIGVEAGPDGRPTPESVQRNIERRLGVIRIRLEDEDADAAQGAA
jgi:deazaflavin-dependent oxidoreductase (nitroreductase family)